jgi:hypothetical protein
MPAFGSMLPWDGGDRRFSVYPPSYNTSNVSVGSGGIERVRRVQLSTSMPAFGSMLSWDVSRLVPFGHVFGPLLSSFRTKFTRYSKSLCKKTTKTSNNEIVLQIQQ